MSAKFRVLGGGFGGGGGSADFIFMGARIFLKYINNLPGAFPVFARRGGMYSHRMNSPKNLAKHSEKHLLKLFSCSRANANTGPALVTHAIAITNR